MRDDTLMPVHANPLRRLPPEQISMSGPMFRPMSMSGPLPCLLLLAAGRSRRLGRPKGGLVARGVPLLVQQLQKARAAGMERALVVLGAGAPRLEKLLTPTLVRQLGFRELRLCHASAWREGMGGSLRDGLRALPSDWRRVLVLLVDQTGVSSNDLRRLAAGTNQPHGQAQWQGAAPAHGQVPRKLIATVTKSGGSPMAPVVLPRTRVQEALRHLHGDRGLGPWLRRLPGSALALAPCAAAQQDLDTPQMAAAWRAQRRQR